MRWFENFSSFEMSRFDIIYYEILENTGTVNTRIKETTFKKHQAGNSGTWTSSFHEYSFFFFGGGGGVKAKTKKSVVSQQIFIQKALPQKRKVGGG